MFPAGLSPAIPEKSPIQRPSIPADEAERLRALSEYGLDARNGLPALDPVVDLAARMFNCPVAAVNMIGDDHVFIISETGLGDYNPSRDVSFVRTPSTRRR